MPVFGCVADDFTGASDAASFLVKGGMSVQLFNGIPHGNSRISEEIQAVVIALKSRTQRKEEAAGDTARALEWLKERGVTQFYLKYCSTFDSTPEGNIGPVADRAMELLQAPYTILCPALPVNGRVVKRGELFVDGVPLQESPMKNHPLTPMWDCRIASLMKPQSRYSSVELWREQMYGKVSEIQALLAEKAGAGRPFYVIPDYEDMRDGERIVELFGDLVLLTGGSGILEHLARRRSRGQKPGRVLDVRAKGSAILLAGSCSKATLGQIRRFIDQGGLSYKINPAAMLEGTRTLQDAWKFVEDNWGTPVLIYSSDTAENVREIQKFGQRRVAKMLEETAASLAELAVNHGICRVIVAGGETSGAVTRRLGFCSFEIGGSAAPGVPIMMPAENPDIRLVLKSGNFGQEDFFQKVLDMTEMGET
ncbi:MAG: four-carbon acid sugar kinase family protein [Clostridium sp.]|nr:four-carbon acid sugar kinase family protein [Clostridium sp.]